MPVTFQIDTNYSVPMFQVKLINSDGDTLYIEFLIDIEELRDLELRKSLSADSMWFYDCPVGDRGSDDHSLNFGVPKENEYFNICNNIWLQIPEDTDFNVEYDI